VANGPTAPAAIYPNVGLIKLTAEPLWAESVVAVIDSFWILANGQAIIVFVPTAVGYAGEPGVPPNTYPIFGLFTIEPLARPVVPGPNVLVRVNA
jgi:hypothetical protein